MVPKDRDDELLEWMAHRLLPDRGQDNARLEKMLTQIPITPFSSDEVNRILRKARGKLPLHGETTPLQGIDGARQDTWKGRTLTFVRKVPVAVRWAAAACLLLALGTLACFALRPGSGDPTPDRPGTPQPYNFALGLVRPISNGTQIVAVNLDAGEFRLDRGGVYLQTDSPTGAETEIATPLGTISAADARCYVHLFTSSSGQQILAVTVLDGQVELQGRDGRGIEIGDTGELLYCEGSGAPERHSPTLLTQEDQEWSQAQEVLQLLHDSDIQERLHVDPANRKQLALPRTDEDGQVETLVNSLPALPREERKQKARLFFTQEAGLTLAMLDGSQRQQFDKIQLQKEGLAALIRKDVSEKLKLDQHTKDEIRNQLAKLVAAKQALFLHGDGSCLNLGKALAELDNTQAGKILKLLKPDQRKTWKDMVGPFETGPGSFDIGKKGMGFGLFSMAPRSEEQLWDAWLQKTAKRVNMTSDQLKRATELLQKAKKEAAKYRQGQQEAFKKFAFAFPTKKFEKPTQHEWEKNAEALHAPIDKIGDRWKGEVMDLLTASQRKLLAQVGQQEMPQGLGVHVFWDKVHKKGLPQPPGGHH